MRKFNGTPGATVEMKGFPTRRQEKLLRGVSKVFKNYSQERSAVLDNWGSGGKVGEEYTSLGVYGNLFDSALTDGEISMVTGWLGLWMIRVKGRSFQGSRRPWRKTPASLKSKPGTGIASLPQFRCATHSQASPDATGIAIDPLLPGWKV